MALDKEPDNDDFPGEAETKTQRRRPPMDERELVAILRAEEVDASSYFTSELAKDQADLLDRYFAKKYGDEVDDRSSVCTHDIEDTLNWMLPDLMRVFLQSDDLITIDDASGMDEGQLQIAADYLRHVFFKDNEGEAFLHDFAFDGLLQRCGVASVRWEDAQPKPPEMLKGVPPEQAQRYADDPEYQILGQTQRVEQIDTPMGPQQIPVFDMEVQHTPKCGRVRIENVPPEEFAISRRARSLKPGGYDYCRRIQTNLYCADLIRLYPDSAADLDPDFVRENAKEIESNSDPRTLARFQSEAISTNRESSNHSKRKKVDLYTEYIWIDFDNDGVVELRQIKRVGDVILENERVEDCEYVLWSPIRVAHRLIGRAVADTIVDIQKIRTVVTRRTLDSLDQSLLPRTAYDKTRLDPEDVDALVDAEVGGLIGTKGSPAESLMPIQTPDLTASGFQMLEYWDAKAEQASGVTRHQQGLQPDSANKTATGIDLLQQAAGDRIELVARWMAHGVEQVLDKALKLLVRYQDAPRVVKLQGSPLQVDPRRWSDEMSVSCHVAMASSNRQTMLMNLGLIAQKQEQIILQAGPSNPICGFVEYAHTLSRMVETMGFRASEKFFKRIDPNNPPPPPPPQPDPKMIEVQQKGQIAQAQMQLDQQATAAKLQMEQQRSAAELEHAKEKALLEAQLSERKQQVEAELKARQQNAEAALAERQQNFEMQLAIRKQEFEERLAEQQAEHQKEMAQQAHELKKTEVKNSVRFGGEVG